ncbi:MAG TPA: AraC family transcriptional regulator [Cyclobacteriaceae bacterium]|nr:AraC family transcriptional regulator [Cyclobacteriaceae bacterium]
MNIPGRSHQQAIQLFHNFIENHLDESLNIRSFADMANLSYHRFHHLYTEITGEPFGEYVKRYRLENAAGYLRHSSWSVAEIGERVGYYTKSSFSKAFSQHFNSSPGRFRTLKTLPIDSSLQSLGTDPFEHHPAIESHRFQQLPESYFHYNRANTFNPAVLFDKIAALQPGDNVVVASPDVICVSSGSRVDIGCISVDPSHSGSFGKRISAGRYFVVTYRGSFTGTPAFVYQLIDAGSKHNAFKIRDHMTFVKITKGQGLCCEVWVPVL